MLRKLKWQIPGEPFAARYNWCQGPVPGRGPAVEKHWHRGQRKYTDKTHDIHITVIFRWASSIPWIPTKMNCYSSHNYKQYSPTSNNCSTNIINYPLLLPKNLLLYMFRTVPLSIIRSLFTVHSAMVNVIYIPRETQSLPHSKHTPSRL